MSGEWERAYLCALEDEATAAFQRAVERGEITQDGDPAWWYESEGAE